MLIYDEITPLQKEFQRYIVHRIADDDPFAGSGRTYAFRSSGSMTYTGRKTSQQVRATVPLTTSSLIRPFVDSDLLLLISCFFGPSEAQFLFCFFSNFSFLSLSSSSLYCLLWYPSFE